MLAFRLKLLADTRAGAGGFGADGLRFDIFYSVNGGRWTVDGVVDWAKIRGGGGDLEI